MTSVFVFRTKLMWKFVVLYDKITERHGVGNVCHFYLAANAGIYLPQLALLFPNLRLVFCLQATVFKVGAEIPDGFYHLGVFLDP